MSKTKTKRKKEFENPQDGKKNERVEKKGGRLKNRKYQREEEERY